MLERGPRDARIVEAEDDERRAPRASRSAGRRRSRRARSRPAGRRRPRASARRRARARRSGRAGRGRDCRGRPHAGARAAAPPGRAASSTSRRPSSACRAARRVEATPETRFAPEWLCARRKRGRRISAAIAAVVVLPFVAEMTAVPAGSRAASRSIAPGSSFERSLPGTVIPAPAPTRRESAATPRAARISRRRQHAREGTRRAGVPRSSESCRRGPDPSGGGRPPLPTYVQRLHVYLRPVCVRAWSRKKERKVHAALTERMTAVIARTRFGDEAREASLVRTRLWGRGGRRAGAAISVFVCLAMASVAGAGLRTAAANGGSSGNLKAYVPATLLSAIQQNPTQSFDVILQGDRSRALTGSSRRSSQDKSGSSDENVRAGTSSSSSNSIDGAQLTLTGKQILRIAKNGIAQSIVPNETVRGSGGISISTRRGGPRRSMLWPNWLTHARERADDRDRRLGHPDVPRRFRLSRARPGQPDEPRPELAR